MTLCQDVRKVATQVRTHRTHRTQNIRRLRQDATPADRTQDPFLLITPEEKYHKDYIHRVTKGAGIKLMVWACIWCRNKRPLIPIFGKSVDRFVYIGVLEDGLVDVWQEVEDTVGEWSLLLIFFMEYNVAHGLFSKSKREPRSSDSSREISES